MARIPKLGTGQRISSDVSATPSRSLGSAGLVGRATQQIGQAVGGLADVASLLATKLAKAEDQEFIDSQSREYKNSIKRFTQNRKVELQGDLSTLGTDVENFSATELSRITETAPSNRAKSIFTKSANSSRDAGIQDANNDVSKFRIARLKGSMLDSIAKQGQHFFDNPDVDEAIADIEKGRADTAAFIGTVFEMKDAEAVQDSRVKANRDSVLNGLISKGAYTQAQTILRGGVPKAEVFLEGITPAERKSFENQIKAGRKLQRKTFEKAVAEDVKNLEDKLVSGDRFTPQEEAQSRATLSMVLNLPESDKRTAMLDDLKTSEAVGLFIKQAHKMSEAEIIDSNIDSIVLNQLGLDNRISRQKIKRKVEEALAKIIIDRNKDGAAYVEKYHPEITDPKKSFALQKELGIKNPRYTSKTQSRREAGVIKEAVTDKQLGENLEAFLIGKGQTETSIGTAPEELKQMVDDKNLDPSYLVAQYLGNIETRGKVIKASRDDKIINELYLAANVGSKEDMVKQVALDLSDVLEIFSETDNQKDSNDMLRLVSRHARQLSGKPGSNLNLEDASEEAVKQIIDENFIVLNHRNAKMLIPLKFNVALNVAEEFADRSLSGEALERLGVSLKQNKFNGSYSEFSSALRNSSQFKARWIGNGKGNGLILIADDRNSIPFKIIDDNKLPIEVKFKEMSNFLQFEDPRKKDIRETSLDDLDRGF